MTYDKDREDKNDAYDVALKILSLCNTESTPGNIADIINKHATESADQARKEAADRAVEWFKTVFCVPESARTKGLRAAIIGDSVTVSTDSEKLAIAVKALEYVVSKGMPSNVFESQYSRLQDACTTAGDALKEIQG